MQQYQAIKARYPHALLLFRLGDFYELFYEDAILASRELQITLTSRNREKASRSRCAVSPITPLMVTSPASSAPDSKSPSAIRWNNPARARKSSVAKSFA